jgi:hypothetical protein
MMTLSEHIKSLRGKRNYVEFATVTHVNRQTLKDIEDGKSVLIETVKRIADACGVDAAQWLSILIAWIRLQVGDQEFAKLDIRPALSGSLHVDHPFPAGKDDFGQMVQYLFRQLRSPEQVEIFKALTRPAIREGLATINRVFEAHGGVCTFSQVCQPSHPIIATPEKLNNVLKRLALGDESLFASVHDVVPETWNTRKVGRDPRLTKRKSMEGPRQN